MLLRRTRGKPKNDFTSVQRLIKYMHGSEFLQTFSSTVQMLSLNTYHFPPFTRESAGIFGTDFKELFTDDSLKISCITSLILNK